MAVIACIARVTYCTRARSKCAAGGAAIDAVEGGVAPGRLGRVRGCGARFSRLAVNTFIARVTCCARARFSDAADSAAVDTVELAVGASRLGRVRADCAHFNRLAVITVIPGFACASAVSSVATYRSIVYAVERAVGAGRLGLVR